MTAHRAEGLRASRSAIGDAVKAAYADGIDPARGRGGRGRVQQPRCVGRDLGRVTRGPARVDRFRRGSRPPPGFDLSTVLSVVLLGARRRGAFIIAWTTAVSSSTMPGRRCGIAGTG